MGGYVTILKNSIFVTDKIVKGIFVRALLFSYYSHIINERKRADIVSLSK